MRSLHVLGVASGGGDVVSVRLDPHDLASHASSLHPLIRDDKTRISEVSPRRSVNGCVARRRG